MNTGVNQPVIIIKKGGHGKHGHHGGAWKVAYADFVTAMMAFFLVMWIVGLNKPTRDAVAAYFRDPVAFEAQYGGGKGVLPGAERGVEGGAQTAGMPDVESATKALERAAEHLRQMLTETPQFAALKDRIEIQITDEGLRIELREATNDGFFDTGSAELRPYAIAVLKIISEELSTLPNKVAVEGHTDRRPYGPGNRYTNWELSTDRANAARRVLQGAGMSEGQIDTVRGFADTRLRVADSPFDPGNRRITIVVRRS